MAIAKNIKECLVECCKNNTLKTPEKRFIIVPRDSNDTGRRREWARVLGITNLGKKHRYVCEDHFNLEEDARSWMYFKTMGTRLLLKDHVVPHKNLGIIKTQVTPQLSNKERKLKDKNIKDLEKVGVFKRKRRKQNFEIYNIPELLENKEPSSKRRQEEPELETEINENEANETSIINCLPNVKIIGTLTPIQMGTSIQPVEPLLIVEETQVQIEESEEHIKENTNIETEELPLPVIDIKTEIKEEILDTPDITTTASFEFVNIKVEHNLEDES